MADIFGSVSGGTASATPTGALAGDVTLVRLSFDPAASAALKPYVTQGGTIPLVVKQLLPGDLAVLALPNGQTITAQAPRTPLTLGSQLMVQIPAGNNALANAVKGASAQQVVLTARLAQSVRAGGVTVATATGTQAVNVASPAPLPLVGVQAALRQNPLLAAAEEIFNAAASGSATPTTATQLAAGPVVLTPTSTTTTALPAGPAVVQVTGQPSAAGAGQAATVFPIPAAGVAASTEPVQVVLSAGQTVPTGTEFTVTLTPVSTAVPQPVVVQVARAIPLPPQPLVGAPVVLENNNAAPRIEAPLGIPVVERVAPVQPAPQALSVTLPTPQNLPPIAQVARVMGPAVPVPEAPGMFRQPVLLATGQNALVTTPAPLPPGTALEVQASPTPGTLQVLAVHLPQTPQAPVAANTAAPVVPANLPVNVPLTATVGAEVLSDKTVTLTVTAPPEAQGQTLSVRSDTPLPPGTQLTVRVTADARVVVEDVSLPTGLVGQQTLATFENQWPQLARALATLQQHNPALAADLAARLPQAGALAPGLARYVDALQNQSVEKWLGHPVMTMLRALGVDLTPDLSQLAVFRQPTPDGWQGVIFPYVENPQEQPRQGKFFWKKSQDDQQASRNTRFVVEMNLSQMGEVQLDGLLTYPELWLKLRVHPPADTGFAEGLQNVVQTMLEGFGLNGGITVESLGTFPLDAARLAAHPAEVAVAAEL